MRNSITDRVTLHNGVEMPWFGAGVFKVEQDVTARVVRDALQSGYRMIDTASIYGNEQGVGDGLRESGVDRKDIFLTTKIWRHARDEHEIFDQFDESLRLLQTDYVDLYLIHWPKPMFDQYVATWKAIEKIYKSGRARAIGVSNFNIPHLERLAAECEIVPMVNQIEFHPYLVQTDLQQYLQAHNIVLEAWSPLAKGRILTDPAILGLAAKYGRTPVQVVLRWDMQKGIVTIPKTLTRERMIDNADLFGFSLSETDMTLIDRLDCHLRTGPDPDVFDKR